MNSNDKTLYLASDSRPIEIRERNRIGGGGEGDVYALDDRPELVAKVYREPTRFTRSKLELMANNPPTLPVAGDYFPIAWPADLLLARSAQPGSVVGYVMPKLKDSRQVNQVFNPTSRLIHAPGFTYRHLVTAAANIAIVVDAVHDRNHVIGDVNESNFLIDDRARAILIDADSFQIIDERRTVYYRSLVGKPEYTPPELQNADFRTTDRTQYHDRFGLGVLIFQLLLEGRHPYAGRYVGQGEPPSTKEKISSGQFLHSRRRVPIKPGRGFLPFDTLPPQLRNLFRQCFDGEPGMRPTPHQWGEALTNALETLRECDRNPRHQYFPHAGRCPWCQRTRVFSMDGYPADAPSAEEPLLIRSSSAPAQPKTSQPAPSASAPPAVPHVNASPRRKRPKHEIALFGALAAIAIIMTALYLTNLASDDAPPPPLQEEAQPAAPTPPLALAIPEDTPTATPSPTAAPTFAPIRTPTPTLAATSTRNAPPIPPRNSTFSPDIGPAPSSNRTFTGRSASTPLNILALMRNPTPTPNPLTFIFTPSPAPAALNPPPPPPPTRTSTPTPATTPVVLKSPEIRDEDGRLYSEYDVTQTAYGIRWRGRSIEHTDHYEIEVREHGSDEIIYSVATARTEYLIEGLASCRRYSIGIRAIADGLDPSPWAYWDAHTHCPTAASAPLPPILERAEQGYDPNSLAAAKAIPAPAPNEVTTTPINHLSSLASSCTISAFSSAMSVFAARFGSIAS